MIFESCIEVCFAIDIILRFFHEYRDSETHEVIHSFKKIARKYLCTWFFFDLIAVIPLTQILDAFGEDNNKYVVLIKLFRILRLPKFMRLLDTSKFDLLLDSILEKEPKNPQEEKSRQEKMNIKYISRYAYKVFRLILIAIMLTYFLGSLWYFLVTIMPQDNNVDNFIKKNKIDEKSNLDKLILCCYFVLTTLATIGYGDLSPQTNSEKILGISLMIVGIAFFSYIMGNFNDVLINYDKKMGIVDRRNDLQMWMTSLDKFNVNVPIPRALLKKINDHFNFFWKHDRLSSLTPDDKYLQTMPVPLRIQVRAAHPAHKLPLRRHIPAVPTLLHEEEVQQLPVLLRSGLPLPAEVLRSRRHAVREGRRVPRDPPADGRRDRRHPGVESAHQPLLPQRLLPGRLRSAVQPALYHDLQDDHLRQVPRAAQAPLPQDPQQVPRNLAGDQSQQQRALPPAEAEIRRPS